MECIICQHDLMSPPEVEAVPGMEADPAITACGHIFHRACILEAFSIMGVHIDGVRHFRCLICMTVGLPQDLYPMVASTDAHQHDLAVSARALQAARAEINKLEITGRAIDTARRDAMAYLAPGHIRIAAKCFNCESTMHLTRDCDKELVVRHIKLCAIGYEAQRHIIDRCTVAGALVARFEDYVHIGTNLGRSECHFLFKHWHFGDACPSCGLQDCVKKQAGCDNDLNPKFASIRSVFKELVLPYKVSWLKEK